MLCVISVIELLNSTAMEHVQLWHTLARLVKNQDVGLSYADPTSVGINYASVCE
ncbi:MAG: hypothetical protein PHD43_07135 [Methylococcales bacterium]|nr:hypothetical protein [Methylococcales bacterium]